MGKMKNLRDLLEHELKDLYSAEDQLTEALPKTAKNANNSELKNALNEHLKETKNHKKRLEEIGEIMDISLKGEKCKAMEGLVKECESFMEENADSDVFDAGIIACCQRIEHYEISGYGTARRFAKTLDLDEVADILDETLQEEGDADKKLTKIANDINKKAMAS